MTETKANQINHCNVHCSISGAVGEGIARPPLDPNEGKQISASVRVFCQSHRVTILVAVVVATILIGIGIAMGIYKSFR